jgi:hypothetical protein
LDLDEVTRITDARSSQRSTVYSLYQERSRRTSAEGVDGNVTSPSLKSARNVLKLINCIFSWLDFV